MRTADGSRAPSREPLSMTAFCCRNGKDLSFCAACDSTGFCMRKASTSGLATATKANGVLSEGSGKGGAGKPGACGMPPPGGRPPQGAPAGGIGGKPGMAPGVPHAPAGGCMGTMAVTSGGRWSKPLPLALLGAGLGLFCDLCLSLSRSFDLDFDLPLFFFRRDLDRERRRPPESERRLRLLDLDRRFLRPEDEREREDRRLFFPPFSLLLRRPRSLSLSFPFDLPLRLLLEEPELEEDFFRVFFFSFFSLPSSLLDFSSFVFILSSIDSLSSSPSLPLRRPIRKSPMQGESGLDDQKA
mmetsp:Transcript_140294/g.355961  ORF Transcript_140294/g.355961 Transcript_140294/m.355961 type:complete len:299 (-) Transcript_140294:1-897(-)